MELLEILQSNDRAKILPIFLFTIEDTEQAILLKFALWVRFFFPKYFALEDASFHTQIDTYNLQVYRGELKSFTDIVFRGGAKRQPLDAKILTPRGFTTIGKLKVGDFVIGSDGKPTKVEYLSPIVRRPIYKLQTADGRITECDSEHLWTVRKMSNVKNKRVTIDTQKMLDDELYYSRTDERYPNKEYREYKFALDTVKPVQLEKRTLPLDPYLVGILLGDGSMNKKYGVPRLHFHREDGEHYRSHLSAYTISETKYDKRNSNVGRFGINNVGKDIISLGMNVNCYTKFVPKDYLYGDVAQRKALLEGLMDTDGTVSGYSNNGSSFSSVSKQLATDVVELARSLGGKASIRKNKGCIKMKGKEHWRVNILFTDYKPFRLKRKLDKCGYASHTFSPIISITLVGEKMGRCIKVSNEDGLYVTDDYILTHNTTRTKLFVAFCIANDTEHFRRYIKVLTKDLTNSKQIVTDIYNMFVDVRAREYYPEIFQKTQNKREETMQSFTTSTGVKIIGDTVGTDQRGQLQEDARPDLILFDDFETRKTLRSAVETKTIFDNMEEARTGLSKNGGCVYNCNYISERGNVHKLVLKEDALNKVLIVPIKKDGVPAWSIYTIEQIDQIERDAEDFEGEYLCEPSASMDVLIDRDTLDKMPVEMPVRVVADFKMFKSYDASHRYAIGADVAGGVGLDSSTSVLIDFSTLPYRVVGTYKSNTIKPDTFGYELIRQGDVYGSCVIAPEKNNHGHATIAILKQGYDNIYYTQDKQVKVEENNQRPKEYGWHTNAASKPLMLFALKKAVEDGLLLLSDPDLINEAKSYSRDDLMDKEIDPRLTTRHSDLLIACAIALQMKDFAEVAKKKENAHVFVEETPQYSDIGL